MTPPRNTPAFPVAPVLEHYGVEIRGKKGICRWHEDTKPSLTITPNGLGFTCWACGKTGDAISLIRGEEDVGFRDAVARAAEITGVTDSDIRDAPRKGGWSSLLSG